MIVEWLSDALQDFDSIVEYIAADNPAAAIEQGDAIEQQVGHLGSYPRSGRVGRTPYLAVYRIRKDRVQILRILHGAQLRPKTF
ncbi:MAG TPA: type II toxin-antitoxin system RelE/ParE family toxin [Candidatus Deferrimicrobiaceae bacterium]|jgi:plasmid stabilization system protein ParE